MKRLWRGVLVGTLVAANLVVWLASPRPVAAAGESEEEVTIYQCWYTQLSRGCSEWFQHGCDTVDDCDNG